MIVKIPIYFETDLKVPPEQVPDKLDFVQHLFTKDLISVNGVSFNWPLSPQGEKVTFKILTKSQVMGSMTKHSMKKP